MAVSTSTTADEPVRRTFRRYIRPLWVQVVAGIVIGLILGFAAPTLSENLRSLAQRLSSWSRWSSSRYCSRSSTVSVAQTGSARLIGRLAAKSIVYFEVVTTGILAVTILLALGVGLGHGVDLYDAAVGATGEVQKSLPIQTILLNIIPDNIVGALSQGILLGMLFFAVILGLALGRVGVKAKPVVDVLDGVAVAMFQVTGWVVRIAPLAVIAFVAYNTAFYGWHLLVQLAVFIVVFYLATAIVLGIIFPLVAYAFHAPYFSMLKPSATFSSPAS